MRSGQGSTKLTREEFRRRWRERFYDPAFESISAEIERLEEVAWNAYHEYRKSPRTRRAGPEFREPEFELPIEWLESRARIPEAEKRQRSANGPSRGLLICASPRTDDTCPGEMSKTFRLTSAAREVMEGESGVEVDLLDLSRLTSEYGRVILPSRPACPPRCLSVTGPAPATPTMPWVR